MHFRCEVKPKICQNRHLSPFQFLIYQRKAKQEKFSKMKAQKLPYYSCVTSLACAAYILYNVYEKKAPHPKKAPPSGELSAHPTEVVAAEPHRTPKKRPLRGSCRRSRLRGEKQKEEIIVKVNRFSLHP